MSFCKGPGRVMLPGFQASFSPSDHPSVRAPPHGKGSCIMFLFPGYVIDTPGEYAAAIIITFLMGWFNGFLTYARVHLVNKHAGRLKGWQIRILVSLLYGAQMVNAYWMMLLVMLYESLIFTALISGLTVGYFMFYIGPQEKKDRLVVQNAPCCTVAEK